MCNPEAIDPLIGSNQRGCLAVCPAGGDMLTSIHNGSVFGSLSSHRVLDVLTAV